MSEEISKQKYAIEKREKSLKEMIRAVMAKKKNQF